MSDFPYFVTVDEALEICKKTTLQTTVERVDLDKCHNRILAVDLPSLVDDPPFDNSAMDGFATRYEDTVSSPSELKIIGTIQAAGQEDNLVVGKGQAVRIMTGAPMPKGADSILQIELTSVSGDVVTLSQPSMKHFINVVLPIPFSPIIAIRSPELMVIEKSEMTFSSPYDLKIFSTSNTLL